METFYVRKKKDRVRRGSWVVVLARDMASARKKFVSDENKQCRVDYAEFPALLKDHLIKLSDVSVRKTPPPWGDIMSVTYSNKRDSYGDKSRVSPAYVPRTATPFRGRSKIKVSLQDKQMALLTAMSQKLQWPLMYGNDLYVHDKAMLKRLHPNRFIWSVNKGGTDIYPLDKMGKTLTPREYRWRYNWMYANILSRDLSIPSRDCCKYFLITKATIKEISGKTALDTIIRVFKKAYPKMDIKESE